MPKGKSSSARKKAGTTPKKKAAGGKKGGVVPHHHTHCYYCGVPIDLLVVKCRNCDRHFLYYCPTCPPGATLLLLGATSCVHGHTFESACPSPSKGKPVGGVCRKKHPPLGLRVTIGNMTSDLVKLFPEISTEISDAGSDALSNSSFTIGTIVKYVQTLCDLLQGHVADDKLALAKALAADRLQKCTLWTMADIACTLTGKD